MARKIVTTTAVWRNPGNSTPWHLPHPSETGLTLCGALRGSIASATTWGDENEIQWQCRRCTRLRDAEAVA